MRDREDERAAINARNEHGDEVHEVLMIRVLLLLEATLHNGLDDLREAFQNEMELRRERGQR